MAETISELKAVEVDYICDKCGVGRMRNNGFSYMTDPPQYPHKCDKCGYEAVYYEQYPCLRYIKIQDEAGEILENHQTRQEAGTCQPGQAV